jgi:hypothetical protein
MPDNSRPALQKVPIFRPLEHDREQIERAWEVIEFAKKVLAESDVSSVLLTRAAKAPANDSQ